MDGKDIKIPFALLTNGGGDYEEVRAHKVNTIFYSEQQVADLKRDDPDKLLTGSNMILCNTPFSDPDIVS